MPTSMTTAPGLTGVGGHEFRAAGGDQDIGATGVESEVCRQRMADGDRGAGLQQQHCHRFADDVRAADDHGFLAFEVNTGLREKASRHTAYTG